MEKHNGNRARTSTQRNRVSQNAFKAGRMVSTKGSTYLKYQEDPRVSAVVSRGAGRVCWRTADQTS